MLAEFDRWPEGAAMFARALQQRVEAFEAQYPGIHFCHVSFRFQWTVEGLDDKARPTMIGSLDAYARIQGHRWPFVASCAHELNEPFWRARDDVAVAMKSKGAEFNTSVNARPLEGLLDQYPASWRDYNDSKTDRGMFFNPWVLRDDDSLSCELAKARSIKIIPSIDFPESVIKLPKHLRATPNKQIEWRDTGDYQGLIVASMLMETGRLPTGLELADRLNSMRGSSGFEGDLARFLWRRPEEMRMADISAVVQVPELMQIPHLNEFLLLRTSHKERPLCTKRFMATADAVAKAIQPGSDPTLLFPQSWLQMFREEMNEATAQTAEATESVGGPNEGEDFFL